MPKIYACPFCLSKELDFAPGGRFAAFTYVGIGPLSGHALCKNCRRMILPITFNSEGNYQIVLKKLKSKD